MKKNYKKIIPIMLLIVTICTILLVTITNMKKNKNELNNVNIEEILRTESYSYLPEKAKNYVREVYEEEGTVLLTEKNKEENIEYLNPQYVDYLQNKDKYFAIPSETIVDYVANTNPNVGSNFPATYDLRNVDGKNYVTPFKNQGSEGLCWDYATNAHIESFLLFTNNKEYDSTATILSEKQIDYATARNGVEVENHLYNNTRDLIDGGSFSTAANIMLDGLGIVPSSWDGEHQPEVSRNEILDRSEIYDFENSLYELNSTFDFPSFNYLGASEAERESYLNDIKTNIMTYGGAYVSTNVCYDSLNMYNGERTKVVDVMQGGGCIGDGYHALQIIGWDDDFEWSVCKRTHGYVNAPAECGQYGYASGKGVWILKNSWGNTQSIVLLAYESIGTDINFVTNLGERTWDNFYKTDKTYVNTTTATFKFKPNAYIPSEKLNKIKFSLAQNSTVTVSMSNNGGSSYTNIGSVTTTFKGYYYLDVSSSNYTVNENTIFKITTTGNQSGVTDLRVYTNNKTTNKSLKADTIIYNVENETLNSTKFFDFYLYSQTKNIENRIPLTVRIKNSSGEYLPTNSYTFTANKVYANTSYAKLTINSDYFTKGTYTIETAYDDNSYSESSFNIDVDLVVSEGEGTSENPWKIYTTSQFNLIRNNSKDSFVLMNDLDFEYDTKDPNGLFYNNGYGFEAIDSFDGYLDGNGYQIKNLYSKSEINTNNNTDIRKGGIFKYAFFGTCVLEECGFRNIIVSNPTIIGSYDTGGLVNDLILDNSEEHPVVIQNISVVGGTVSSLNQPTYNIGGIAGSINYYGEKNQSMIIKNLYNSATVTGNSNKNAVFAEKIGGIAGSFGGDGDGGKLYINNAMNVGKIKHSTYYSSISGISNFLGGYMVDFEVNNLISINNDYPAINTSDDVVDYSEETTITFNNVYTDYSVAVNTEYMEDYIGEINNTLTNKSIYELANADYSNWNGFSSNWNQYNADGVKRIPVLKNVDYGYFEMDTEATLEKDETIELLDLVTNNKYNSDIEVVKSCDYELNVCSNTTDESVISLNGTAITGIENGTTTVIVKNKHDGYINAIDITVGGVVTKEVTFDANGGTGTMTNQTFNVGEEFTLKENTFTRSNYSFKHWNTKSDDTGTEYYNGQKVTLTDDTTLYAIWQQQTFTVTFDANGGTGSMQPQTFTLLVYQALSPNTFIKEHHVFDHWNTRADDSGEKYEPEEIIAVGEDMTLYAIYTKKYYDVNFNSYGGSAVPKQTVASGEKATRPTNPTKDGWIFVDWYTESSYENVYDFDDEVTKELNLVAKWRRPVITWDINGGTPGPNFHNQQVFDAGENVPLPELVNLGVTAPDNYEFDAYEIKGARYLPTQTYQLNDDVTIKILWKEIVIIEPEEYYEVKFKKISTAYESVPNGTNLTTYINEKKTAFNTVINNFKAGKDNVIVDEYSNLFTSKVYAVFDSFELTDTDEDDINNTITYRYEVKYTEMTPIVETIEKNEYELNKVEDKEEELPADTDIEKYIAEKKAAFQDEVNDETDIDDLFVVDKTNNTYKYAEFIEEELDETVNDEENHIITNYYNYNYNLVTVTLVDNYTLTYKDSTISFKGEADKEFEFTLISLSSNPDKFTEDEIKNVKELVKKKGEFVDIFKITVQNDDDEVHDGPFKLKVKLTDEMKKYDKFYLVYVGDDKTEEPIEFISDGEYMSGTLKHLSDYAVVGTKNADSEDNPATFDNVFGYFIIMAIVVVILINAKKLLKIKKYE